MRRVIFGHALKRASGLRHVTLDGDDMSTAPRHLTRLEMLGSRARVSSGALQFNRNIVES